MAIDRPAIPIRLHGEEKEQLQFMTRSLSPSPMAWCGLPNHSGLC